MAVRLAEDSGHSCGLLDRRMMGAEGIDPWTCVKEGPAPRPAQGHDRPGIKPKTFSYQAFLLILARSGKGGQSPPPKTRVELTDKLIENATPPERGVCDLHDSIKPLPSGYVHPGAGRRVLEHAAGRSGSYRTRIGRYPEIRKSK
jgi:hypothetical protein